MPPRDLEAELLQACFHGNASEVARLIALGAGPNATNDEAAAAMGLVLRLWPEACLPCKCTSAVLCAIQPAKLLRVTASSSK